jgi:hypothetical protein
MKLSPLVGDSFFYQSRKPGMSGAIPFPIDALSIEGTERSPSSQGLRRQPVQVRFAFDF